VEYKNIEIKWLGHSGFFFKYNGINIYIDPIRIYNPDEKADLILITHGHHDHLSVEIIKSIIKSGTKIIGPAEVLSQTRQIKDGIDFEIADFGKKINFFGIVIEGVYAYNIDKPFHLKGDCVGYIIDFSGARVYHAGDTDLINEMQKIKCDVALLPVSGKFTMTADEAAKAAEIIHPDLAIPMHWGILTGLGTKEDAEKFVSLCKERGINAKVMEKEI
jgi:L-ascorbate metabolism protein UlaG (beta-lactamase superfamily)